jgi:uncharacterized protein YegP (UPF0339 family)
MIEINKSSDNTYHFLLKSKSGTTLLNSVDFMTRDAVLQTVGNLPPLLKEQAGIERRTDHSGKFLFCLKGPDGKLIAKSVLYSSEAGMENGIKNLRKQLASGLDIHSL